MSQYDFNLKATEKTPEIIGDKSKGYFHIKGISIPENSRDFYRDFREWVLELLQNEDQNILAVIDLEYFNTSSSSILLDIFKHLLKASHKVKVEIQWHFDEDDYDMEEAGEDYKMMVGDILTLHPKKFEI